MSRKPAKNSLQLKNLQAWIDVDGKRLDCHAVDSSNRRAPEAVASCWIASEENKTFSVTLRKTKFSHRHLLFLDGTRIETYILGRMDGDTTIFDGLYTNHGVRHFKFSPLSTTDEEEYRDAIALRPNARKIGEISLEVRHIISLQLAKSKKVATSGNSGQDANDEALIPQPQKVHESSLKATLVPHQVSFGDLISNNHNNNAFLPGGAVINTPEDDDGTYWDYKTKDLLVTFTFRYRPLDVLVDGGIVPRRLLNPEAESSEDEDEDEDEDVDTDDREFRGSPPFFANTTGPRRASTRVASVAPNGNGKRVNYMDYDSTEGEDDDSDIYVRTDEERTMQEAQAEGQGDTQLTVSVQPEGLTSTVASIVPAVEGTAPASEVGLNTSATAAPALTSDQSNMETIPTEMVAPTQPVEVAITEPPVVDNQRQTSPVIRQESEEPTLNLGSATVGEHGQPKDLTPSGAIAKEETRDIKLEEIERKVSPLSEDDEEEEEERELRLKLEAIKERKRKNKELQRAEAAKRVKVEPENRFYFQLGEVVDLVSS